MKAYHTTVVYGKLCKNEDLEDLLSLDDVNVFRQYQRGKIYHRRRTSA